MNTQTLVQKKPTAIPSSTRSQSQSAPRGFSTQHQSDSAPHQQKQPATDLEGQLSRIGRFGHSLGQLANPTNSSAGAPLQTKGMPIQQQEAEEPVEMKAEAAQSASFSPAAKSSSPSSGQSLPQTVRTKMEGSFGTSFSDVNLHLESPQAKSIGALAFTQGNQIHFAPGQYNPQSSSGQALLGHELTHVVQQRSGRVSVPSQSKGAPINADPALEREADEQGAKAARGETVLLPGASNSLNAGHSSPVQNSTQPVQCFLPLLMGMLPKLTSVMGKASGMMGKMGGMGGLMGGMGGVGGLMGGVGGLMSGVSGLMGGMGGMGGEQQEEEE